MITYDRESRYKKGDRNINPIGQEGPRTKKSEVINVSPSPDKPESKV